MAEVSRTVPVGRHRNRRQALEKYLRTCETGPEVLAVTAAYFRAVFHRVSKEQAHELALKLIEMTDREAGEKR